jgi:hypothetical protein
LEIAMQIFKPPAITIDPALSNTPASTIPIDHHDSTKNAPYNPRHSQPFQQPSLVNIGINAIHLSLILPTN